MVSKQYTIKNLLTTEDFDLSVINLDLLRDSLKPIDINILKEMYNEEIIEDYLNKRLLIEAQNVWNQTNIKQVQIEINSDCNLKCRFCPVSIEPMPKNIMSMDIFNEIISQVKKIKTLENVTFSSFNEPLLDPYFEERIGVLKHNNIRLKLMTNASHLHSEHIQLLQDSNILEYIKVNLPSVDVEEYIRMTGSDYDTFLKVLENIKGLIKSGLDIRIAVNGTNQEVKRNILKIQQYFEIQKEKVLPQNTLDRAGSITNEYFQNVNVKGHLSGWCFRPLTWLVFSVNGDMLLCANDYYKKHSYGNIMDGDILDIINSERSINIRKQIYGEENAEDNFICRNCIYMKRGAVFKRFNPLVK